MRPTSAFNAVLKAKAPLWTEKMSKTGGLIEAEAKFYHEFIL